jgi:hypothetical protein
MVKVMPVVVAGMIAITPINPQNTVETLIAAKQKIVTIIHKEGFNTTIDKDGQKVQLPYKEKITVEQPTDSNKGIIGKTVHGTIKAVKTVYWWIKK